MNLFAKLEKSRDFWFLFFTSFIFFLLRLPSLFEPYWYGDEGIYETIGMAMRNGSLLYRDIWDNKPPLLYTVYAIVNGDQFSVRAASLLFGVASIIFFFFLLKKLHASTGDRDIKRTIYVTTGIFAFLFGIPLFEGNIANAENFMLLFSLLSALCLFRYIDTKTPKALWYAGFFLSIETLFKIVGIFDFAAFGFFLLLVTYKNPKQLFNEIKILLPFGLAYLFPIIITFAYFLLFGTAKTFMQAAFSQNVGYVGYGNYFIIPQGLLYLKVLSLGAFLLFLFIKRSLFSKTQLFIFIWLACSLFNAFFSQRPYTHYILVLLPSICLLVFLVLQAFTTVAREQKKDFLPIRYIYIIVLTVVLFLVWNKFDVYKKTIPYYRNFISFMSGSTSLASYQGFFDSDVPNDYAISQFLRNHNKKNATTFLWGNTAQIYKMSETLPPGRYTVAYHVTGSPTGVEETAKALFEKKPRFVIIMSSDTYPFDLSHYRYVYSIQNYHIYERTL